MVLGFFEGGNILIFDIKFDRQFNVNGHRLKLYVTSEPPAPVDMVNLHLTDVHEVYRIELHA